jgi:hypothetical protein
MPVDADVRRAMAILTAAPEKPPPRKIKAKPEARAPPRRRPPAPPGGSDADAENVAPTRRTAPNREPPAKPGSRAAPPQKKVPLRKPPQPKQQPSAAAAAEAPQSSPRPALADVSANGADTPVLASPRSELGACPRQAPLLPTSSNSSSSGGSGGFLLSLEPQQTALDDHDDDDELLRAVEAEVAAAAAMLQPENRRSQYSSSSGSDDESDAESDEDADDGEESGRSGGSSEADSPATVERGVESDEPESDEPESDEPEADDAVAAEACASEPAEPHDHSPLAYHRSRRSPVQLETTAQRGDPQYTLLTPTKSQLDVSTASPEAERPPTFSIRSSRSISSCFDTGSESEATAVAPRPIARRVRGLSLSRPATTGMDGATHRLTLKPTTGAQTTAAAAAAAAVAAVPVHSSSSCSSSSTSASGRSDAVEVVQLRERVAALERQLATKESALVEAFSIIEQLSSSSSTSNEAGKKKHILFAPFYTKHDLFTETGSGQT